MSGKYLILQTPTGEKAVIFPEEGFYHDEMAKKLGSLGINAAGFVKIPKISIGTIIGNNGIGVPGGLIMCIQ